MHSTRQIAASALLSAALLAGLPAAAHATGQVGDPAADFSLKDTAGLTHTLSAHAGEVVFLFMIGYS